MKLKLIILFSLYFACGTIVQAKEIDRAEYIMGTVFKLKFESSLDNNQAEKLADGVFAIIRSYDQLLSDYNVDSELMYVEKAAKQNPLLLSQKFCQAMIAAQYYSQITHGAFDITVRPLITAWGFKDQNHRVPEIEEITQYLAAVGQKHLQRQNCRLFISNPKTHLDFGAIGKGLAIDAAADYLKKHGIQAAVIEGGGSSHYFLGAPAKSPKGWPVALRQDSDAVFWLKNQAVASSGDDQQFFKHNGHYYSHIIDPRSGHPIHYRGSITIIANTATTADAMSTALMVLGDKFDAQYSELLQLQIIRQY